MYSHRKSLGMAELKRFVFFFFPFILMMIIFHIEFEIRQEDLYYPESAI